MIYHIQPCDKFIYNIIWLMTILDNCVSFI